MTQRLTERSVFKRKIVKQKCGNKVAYEIKWYVPAAGFLLELLVCGGVQVAVHTEHLVNVVAAVEPAEIPALAIATYDLEIDLAEWVERPTANASLAFVLGLMIQASSDTMESEGAADKAVLNTVLRIWIPDPALFLTLDPG
jgi:hypothetical protein